LYEVKTICPEKKTTICHYWHS